MIDSFKSFLIINGRWLFPSLLLLLKIFLKSVILQKPAKSEVWEKILEIPIELEFLAISFILAAALFRPENSLLCLGIVLGFIIITVISIVLNRLSPSGPNIKSLIISGLLFVVNIFISLFTITFSINLIIG